MDYQTAIAWLDGLVNYERKGLSRYAAGEFKLDAVRRLAALLGAPQQRFPAVHIAGTKGKGSVAAITEAVAREADYHTGLFTSPHLVSVRERIRVDGAMIDQQQLAGLVTRLRPLVEQVTAETAAPSFFEVHTAMAFEHFAQVGVELGVLETGLGGRLDATNICQPVVCAITTLGIDHTALLGTSIEQIAYEKAGIIKRGVPVVLADNPSSAMEVIREKAEHVGAPLVPIPRVAAVSRAAPLPVPARPGRIPRQLQRVVLQRTVGQIAIKCPLQGAHQATNLAVAVGIADVLRAVGYDRIDDDAIVAGARNVDWPGRLEIVGSRPWVVLDCAHNPQSARAVAETLPAMVEHDKLILVIGVSRDKDVPSMARELAPLTDTAVLTQAAMPRAMPVERLRVEMEPIITNTRCTQSVAEAVALARQLAGPRDCILVTGSFFIIDEYMQLANMASR